MNMRTLFSSLAIVLSLPAVVSFAQTARPAGAPAPTATAPAAEKSVDVAPAVVPKHKCARPDLPGKFENEAQQQAFVKQMDSYRDCLMAYRNEMNKLAQAHIAAANGAIDEFNAFVKTVNGQ